MLLVNRIGCEDEPCRTLGTLIVVVDIDSWEVIRFGKLPSELGRVSLVQREGHEEIELVGIAKSDLVGHAWADRPHIGNLRIVPADIAGLAFDGADSRAQAFAWIVSRTLRDCESVGWQ